MQMKQWKSVKRPLAPAKADQPLAPQGRTHGPEAAMHTETPIRKTGGRLSREDQRRLGDILQRVYDEVVRQGVPDRFKALLDELEEPPEQQQRHAARERRSENLGATDRAAESERDHMFEPDRTTDPTGKGPH
jgi:hypothetical protein